MSGAISILAKANVYKPSKRGRKRDLLCVIKMCKELSVLKDLRVLWERVQRKGTSKYNAYNDKGMKTVWLFTCK